MIAILQKELRDALRNRWLQGYTLVLAALSLVAAWSGLRASEGLALQTYGRTAATLTNLCLFLAPLVSLVLGASAIAARSSSSSPSRSREPPCSAASTRRCSSRSARPR